LPLHHDRLQRTYVNAFWGWRQELNLQPFAYKASAPPIELHQHKQMARFELASRIYQILMLTSYTTSALEQVTGFEPV
jgi:hypothetical protein